MRAFAANLVTAGLSMLLGACAVAPSVTYEQDRREDAKGHAKFQLQRSSVLVSFKQEADGTQSDRIVVDSVPADDLSDPIFSIVPADPWAVTTHLKLTYRPDSMLLQSIGTEVQDRRVETLQAIGGVLTGLFKGATPPPEEDERDKPKLPRVIDLTRDVIDELARKDPAKARNAIVVNAPEYIARISKVADDAIAREAYVRRIAGVPQSVFFYAACRDVQLEFTARAHKWLRGKKYSVRISDPNYVRTIAFPAKGTITLHAGCGVDVTSEKAEIASSAQVAHELVKQVKAYREARGGGSSSGQ